MYDVIHNGIAYALEVYNEYPKKILVSPNEEIAKHIGKVFFGIDVVISNTTDEVTLVM